MKLVEVFRLASVAVLGFIAGVVASHQRLGLNWDAVAAIGAWVGPLLAVATALGLVAYEREHVREQHDDALYRRLLRIYDESKPHPAKFISGLPPSLASDRNELYREAVASWHVGCEELQVDKFRSRRMKEAAAAFMDASDPIAFLQSTSRFGLPVDVDNCDLALQDIESAWQRLTEAAKSLR